MVVIIIIIIISIMLMMNKIIENKSSLNKNSLLKNTDKICIIGLGYVGLPLAVEFSKKFSTIGFDIDTNRIKELNKNIDETNEVSSEALEFCDVYFSDSINDISDCNIYIITVPTPIDEFKKPDLTFLKNASNLIGDIIDKGNIVIYESTVYPGCTRDECIPIIEKKSGLKLNKDFYCGYSPERINPGDKINKLTNITKIVSGSNEKTKKIVSELYSSILTDASTFEVSSIEIAEAAKVIENTQRDLNIAFVNELSLIFEKLKIDTNEVIEAASTKWNFISLKPGLVGGHCIGVDPYYLTHKSELAGYSPEIILSGRNLNDNMGKYIARRVVKLMISNKTIVEDSNVLILGFTFKENCPDTRNTKVIDIINELEDYNSNVEIYDPWIDADKLSDRFNKKFIKIINNKIYDAIILAVSHADFKDIKFNSISSTHTVIFDVKSFLPEIKDRKVYKL